MRNWKTSLCSAACALILAAGILPAQAVMPEASSRIQQHRENSDFQNPPGTTVDLIFIHTETDGKETVVKTVKRAIIPAGTASVTLELQQQLLPEGWRLKAPADQPLREDTLKVRIPVEPVQMPEATEPGSPSEKPAKPQAPAEKPAKPQKPSEKPRPDPSNPKTGDTFSPVFWIIPGAAAGILLLVIQKKKSSCY